jgi:ParB-like chromosome segregation protein Spo0J
MLNALKLEMIYRSVDDLLPYARNPRKNDHAVNRGASFIKEFGFLVPVLIKKDLSVIDGHLRLKCAKKLNIADVPTITIDHLNEVQIKALRLSINRFSELADWDDDLLKMELMELDNLQYDVNLLDFDVKIDDDHNDKKDQQSDQIKDKFDLIIKLNNEADQAVLYDELSQRGFECVIL